jgi:cysteinyl-tRNA synthetase
MFELIRDSNRLIDAGQLSGGQAQSLLDWREKLESVLALSADEEGIPEEVREMLLRRAEAREKKQWALSDALRDQLSPPVGK